MGWIGEKIEKLKKLPKSLLVAHIASKFIFGVGLGALLAGYLREYNWRLYGWLLIILSLIVAIPSTYSIFKK